MTDRADGARSFYTILGIGERATGPEIRVAYLNLARLLHPDRVRSGSAAEQRLAERRMREVNEAYEVLHDAARRQEYDRERRAGATGRPAGGSRPGARTSTAGAAAGAAAGATGRPPGTAGRRPTGNPERFDADPSWRDDEGRIQYATDDDDVEVSPLVAFLIQRGPLIAVLLLAAFLFVATAYAGGPADEDPTPTAPTSIACSDTPVTGVTGGSVVLEPC